SGLLDKDPRQRLTADQAQWMLQPVADTDDAIYLLDDATHLAPASHTALLPAPLSRGRDRGRRRLRGPVAIFLASVAAVALGASLAAGALTGHHAAVPSVTRSAKPDPTPSDAGYSEPPWQQAADRYGKHHGWKHGDGYWNQDQHGNGHGNGD